MNRRRGGKRRTVWLRVAGIGAVVAMVIAIAFFVNGFESTGSDAAPRPSAGASGGITSPSEAPATSAKKHTVATKKYVVPGTGQTLTLGAGGGGITIDSSNVHTLTARVTSAAPLYAIGYLIPTSLESPYGKSLHPGSSWSVTTKVNGKPKYAIIWISAGKGGVPATCSITIDGQVAVSETTSGPYGRQVCFA